MKKISLSLFGVLLGSLLVLSPVSTTHAAGLTEEQIGSLLGLLSTFGADGDTILGVDDALRGRETSSVGQSSSSQSVVGSVSTPTNFSNDRVDLKINGKDDSVVVESGESVTVAWSSQNVSECATSWDRTKSIVSNGIVVGPVTYTKAYTVTCFGNDGLVFSDSVVVNVGSAGGVFNPKPRISVVHPPLVKAGSKMTIFGSNFSKDTENIVTFSDGAGTQAVNVKSVTGTSISVMVPETYADGSYGVTVNNGNVSNKANFNVGTPAVQENTNTQKTNKPLVKSTIPTPIPDIEYDEPATDVTPSGYYGVNTSSNSPAFNLVEAGTRDVSLGKFSFTAPNNEGINVKRIALQMFSSNTNDIYNLVNNKVNLYSGKIKIGEAYFISSNFATSTLVNSVTVPAGGSVDIDVRADISRQDVTTGGTPGALLRVGYDGDNTGINGNYGVGINSGFNYPGSSSDAIPAGIRVYRSVPIVENVTPSTATSLAAGTDLYQVRITAGDGHDIGIHALTFQTKILTGPGKVSSFQLVGPTGVVNARGVDADSNGIVRIVFDASSERVIPAGTSKVYRLRANKITDLRAANGTSLQIQLIGEIETKFMETQAIYTADELLKNGSNFIWTPFTKSTPTESSSINSVRDWADGYGVKNFVNGRLQERIFSDGYIASTPVPTITEFRISHELSEKIRSTTLVWNAENVTACYISGPNFPEKSRNYSSSEAISTGVLNSDSTYRLICENSSGSIVEKQLTIKVPASTENRSLTSTQIEAIISLLNSFGENSYTVANVKSVLSGSTAQHQNSISNISANQSEAVLNLLRSFGADSSIINAVKDIFSRKSSLNLDVKVNNSDGPVTVQKGESFLLSWTTTGKVKSCHRTYNGYRVNAGSYGYVRMLASHEGTATVSVECEEDDVNGSVSDSVTVSTTGTSATEKPSISYVQALASERNILYSGERTILYGNNLDKDSIRVVVVGAGYQREISVYNQNKDNLNFTAPTDVTSGTPYEVYLVYRGEKVNSVRVTGHSKTQETTDLTIEGMYLNNKSVLVGQKARIIFTIANRGTGSKSVVKDYRFLDQAGGYSYTVSPHEGNTCAGVTYLAPGNACLVATDITFTRPGSKTLVVKVDSDDRVKESNENNNEARLTIDVGSPTDDTPAPTIDLRVNGQKSVTVDPNTTVALSWSTSNASYCKAFGSWGSYLGISGREYPLRVGQYSQTYTVQCSSDFGKLASDSVTVNVNTPIQEEPNKAPIIRVWSGPTTIRSGEVGTWGVSALDLDGKVLNIKVFWGDENSSVSGTTRTVNTSYDGGVAVENFQHAYSIGNYSYTARVIVTDGEGLEAYKDFLVNVTSSNGVSSGGSTTIDTTTTTVSQGTITATGPLNSFGAPTSAGVTWNSEGVKDVKIEACYNNKSTCTTLVDRTPASNKYWIWNIPTTAPYAGKDDIFIKITDADNSSVSDYTDSSIRIVVFQTSLNTESGLGVSKNLASILNVFKFIGEGFSKIISL